MDKDELGKEEQSSDSLFWSGTYGAIVWERGQKGVFRPSSPPLLPPGNQPCPLASVESFSLARRRWEALPAMPTARCSCSSLQAGPRLFVIGGVAQGPSQAVEALCLRDGV